MIRAAALLLSISIAATLTAGSLVAAPSPRVAGASGSWAILSGPRGCEAASAALLPATRTRAQGRASLAFDSDGRGRRGQLAIFLSRLPRSGSSVMLTIGNTPFLLVTRGQWAWSRGPAQEAAIIAGLREASGMRVEARSAAGRVADRYDLAGAPTAIDAAAACALARR